MKTNNISSIKNISSSKEISNINNKSYKQNYHYDNDDNDVDSLDDGRNNNISNTRFSKSKVDITNNKINNNNISSPDKVKVNNLEYNNNNNNNIDNIDNINTNNSIDDNKKSNRYAESTEREKLISRLLTEHSNKKQLNNTNNNNNNDSKLFSESVKRIPHDDDSDDDPYILDTTLNTSATPKEVDNNYYDEDSEEKENSLYFASELNAWNKSKPKVDMFRTIRPNSAPTKNITRDYYDDEVKINRIGGNKYLKSREELKKEYDETFNQEFNFKPKLSGKVEKELKQTSKEPNLSERVKEMHMKYENSMVNREKQKRDLEKLELSQCTFKPQICKGTESIVRSKVNEQQTLENERRQVLEKQQDSSSVLEKSRRMYEEAEQRSLQQKWLEKKVQEARMSQYTFQPVINPVNATIVEDYRPIHERLADIQREKNRKIAELKAESDEAQVDLTFAPKIDNHSRKLAEKRLSGQYRYGSNDGGLDDDDENPEQLLLQSDVGTRLIIEGKKAAQRKQQLAQEYEKQEALSMEQAKVSKGTESIAARNPKVGASFDVRQQMHNAKLQRKNEERKNEIEQQMAVLFKPEIGKSEDIIARSRPQILHETPEDRIFRLSNLAAQEAEEKRKEIEKKVYGGMTFKPDIDPVSKALGHKNDLKELYENNRGKHIKEMARKRVEDEVGKEYTYKPTINQYPYSNSEKEKKMREKYEAEHKVFGWADCSIKDLEDEVERSSLEFPRSSININLKEPERMARDIKIYMLEREERRKSELVAREIEELRECTFQPNVKEYNPLNTEPVIIRGLSRHLELKHLHAKQKEENLKREKEVFQVKNVEKFRKTDNTTIVQPFSLSNSERRGSKAVSNLLEEEEAELTFSPTTNELKRNVLRKGLAFDVVF